MTHCFENNPSLSEEYKTVIRSNRMARYWTPEEVVRARQRLAERARPGEDYPETQLELEEDKRERIETIIVALQEEIRRLKLHVERLEDQPKNRAAPKPQPPESRLHHPGFDLEI